MGCGGCGRTKRLQEHYDRMKRPNTEAPTPIPVPAETAALIAEGVKAWRSAVLNLQGTLDALPPRDRALRQGVIRALRNAATYAEQMVIAG